MVSEFAEVTGTSGTGDDPVGAPPARRDAAINRTAASCKRENDGVKKTLIPPVVALFVCGYIWGFDFFSN